MQVELTSPAKGKMPGETVTVTDGEGRWLQANGYAKLAGNKDQRRNTSIEAKNDPTLAANREDPGDPPGHLTNVGDKSWSDKVTENQEFKGSTVAAAKKILPGQPQTNISAAEAAGTADPEPEPEPDPEPDPDPDPEPPA